jgi:hypothetical protein
MNILGLYKSYDSLNGNAPLGSLRRYLAILFSSQRLKTSGIQNVLLRVYMIKIIP